MGLRGNEKGCGDSTVSTHVYEEEELTSVLEEVEEYNDIDDDQSDDDGSDIIWLPNQTQQDGPHSDSEIEGTANTADLQEVTKDAKQTKSKSVRGRRRKSRRASKSKENTRRQPRRPITEAKNLDDDRKTFIWELDDFSISVAFPEEIEIVTNPPRPPKLDKTCPICAAMFATIKDVDKHARDEHSDVKQPFVCSQCGHRFEKMKRLEVHIFHLHTEEGQVLYRQSLDRKNNRRRGVPLPKEYRELANRRRREQSKSCVDGRALVRLGNSDRWVDPNSTPPLKCPDCTEEFDTMTKLRRHHAAEHQERRYICQICGKGFATRFTLSSHFRGHTEDRPYVCEECGITCKTINHLNIHIRRTHDETGREEYRLYNIQNKRKRRLAKLAEKSRPENSD